MNTFILTALAGVVGTAGMSLVLWGISQAGIANAAMIRAIGSMFTRSYEDSFGPGLIVHFIAGVIIAFVYVALISLLSPQSLAGTIAYGGMIGLAHGVAFGFLLVVAVAEHHPLEQFRRAGLEVAIAHLAGHVIYGVLVGTIVGLTGVRFFT
ncbi:MAG TPA: hypothetical protein VHC46_08980 [Thermodesulfobacteriota bacterium]|nr:hypothetical protein [Thermodesulfobacteriota bacterium]